MFESAIKNLINNSKRTSNYIILYRKVGNYIENVGLALEKDILLIS